MRDIIADPKTFNPVLVTDQASNDAIEYLFEALVRLDPRTGDVEPALADRWEHDDAGTVWTFHLRPNVRWHDGQPFTAEDVRFSFEAIYDPRVPNSGKHMLTVDGRPIAVEVVGPIPFASACRVPSPRSCRRSRGH